MSEPEPMDPEEAEEQFDGNEEVHVTIRPEIRNKLGTIWRWIKNCWSHRKEIFSVVVFAWFVYVSGVFVSVVDTPGLLDEERIQVQAHTNLPSGGIRGIEENLVKIKERLDAIDANFDYLYDSYGTSPENQQVLTDMKEELKNINHELNRIKEKQ